MRSRARWGAASAVCVLSLVSINLSTESAPWREAGAEESTVSVYAAPAERGRGSIAARVLTTRSARAQTKSIVGSAVTHNGYCYHAAAINAGMCFVVQNGSADGEWLDRVELTFPDFPGLGPWTVSCRAQDAADSSSHPVNFSCGTPAANRVTYVDSDADGAGEITSGSSWEFCLDVWIPGSYDGPRIVNWNLSGDEPGTPPPHDLAGQLTLEQCMPLMVFPAAVAVDGCAGKSQTLHFHVWNKTVAMRTIDLGYPVLSGNGVFFGPPSIMPSGLLTLITTELEANLCLAPGSSVNARLEASASIDFDFADITLTTSAFAGWNGLQWSPVASMDNVVAWAVVDGGLWSVGGYGASGATQRYDPDTDTWSTHAPEPAPRIEYPGDGCYGIGPGGDEVIVLFPDTDTTATALHRYNISDDVWDTPPIPVGFPSARWSQDIVSLYGITGQNLCYISGGATTQGGGDVNNLWSYQPDANITIYLGNYTHHPAGFDFHASWYVPWVGAGGAICVGGGVDKSIGAIADTQCYDLAAAQFNAPNADLGLLPEPWWGMADGWGVHQGRHQIWIANGIAQSGTLLRASAYQDETTGGFVYGPEPPDGLYRLEGDGWEGRFHALQGSSGGFTPTTHTFALQPCPVCGELIFADGFE